MANHPHILKVAIEVRMPDSNESVAVLQEKIKLAKEFTLKMEQSVYERILATIQNLTSVLQMGPSRFVKGPITYWTKFDPNDIHGQYYTIPPNFDRRKELPPARQNGPNGPGTFSVQYVTYIYTATYNGDPIEPIGRPPFELLN
jgi:hypothetical protein